MPIIPKQDENNDPAASVQLGVELGVLIAGLRVSDEVKESLLILMEQASAKQLIALREALAHALLMETTKGIDEQYEQKLRQLVKDFEKHQDDIELEADNELVMIRQELESKQSAKTPGAILI